MFATTLLWTPVLAKQTCSKHVKNKKQNQKYACIVLLVNMLFSLSLYVLFNRTFIGVCPPTPEGAEMTSR